MLLQPPAGSEIQKLSTAPLTSSAKSSHRNEKSADICFTCDGRGLILCVSGVFRAKMKCPTCKGDGVTKV